MSLSRLLSIVLVFFLLVGAFAVFTYEAQAAVPKIIHYQGRLYNASGSLLGGTGTNYFFKYSIWDTSTVGTGVKLWPTAAPTETSVSVQNGVFNYDLGSGPDGDLSVIDFQGKGDTLYLQIEVSATSGGTFETLSPRQRIVSASNAINAEQLQGATPGTGANKILKLNATGGLDLSDANPNITVTALNSNLTLAANGTGKIQFFNSSYTVSSTGALVIGSITGTGALTIASGGTNTALTLKGSGTGDVEFFNASNKISSSGNLTIVGGITAATSGTINSVNINAGAVSGVSTLNLTGAITGAVATNTINGLIFDGTGGISGTLSSLTPSAAFTIGATAQDLTLQGGVGTKLTATSGTFTNSLNFVTPAGSSKVINIPNEAGTLCVQGATSCGFQASGNYIVQVPGSTAVNTISPTAASVVGLTVKGTTGTSANVLEIFDSTATPTRQSFFDNTGALNTTKQFISTLATGTAPFSVASTTVVTNLNAALLNGATFASPGAIGSTTAGTGAFTTISATGQITSTLATGTAPFSVTSTTNVANLNASSLNGATFANPGTIGGGTPAAATFTTLTAQTSITSGTTTVAGLLQAPINNTAGSETALIVNHTGTAFAQAGDLLLDVQEGGVAKFSVDRTGLITTASVNNASVATSAGIVYSKLNLTTSIVGGDLATNITISTTGNLATTGTGTITSAGLLTGSNGLTVSAGTVTLPSNSVADAALSTNVALLNAIQSFTAAKTFATATATDDTLTLSPFVGGAARFLGSITSVDLTAARTYTLPDAGGTFAVAGSNAIGLSSAGAISLTLSGATADAGTTSNSGLVVTSTGVSLLRGCGASQILKWTSPSWTCADDSIGAGGGFIAKNAQDTSSASVAGILYDFTNTNTGASAQVLRLTNDGTSNALEVVQSANPASGKALIYVNNSNASPSGNLIDLRAGGSSKFSVDAAGTVTTASGQSYLGAGALTVSSGGTGSLTLKTANQTLATTNSSNVSITSGDAGGTTSDSGNVIIDVGTATGTTGSILIGSTNALTKFGSATVVVGAGSNLLTGTVDTSSSGNFLRFVNEATEKFKVDVSGTITIAGGQSLTGGGALSVIAGAGSALTLTGNAASSFNTTVGNITLDAAGGTVSLGGSTTLSANAGLTLQSGGTGNLTLSPASGILFLSAGTGSVRRTAAGTLNVNLFDASATTLTITNTGTGVADLNIDEGSLQLAGIARISNAGSATLISGAFTNSSNQLSFGPGSGTTGTVSFNVTGGDKTITIPNETGTLCTNTTVCSNYAPSTGGNYLAKNASDTSSASFAGNLYSLTNTNTGAAGVLIITNSGSNPTLDIAHTSITSNSDIPQLRIGAFTQTITANVTDARFTQIFAPTIAGDLATRVVTNAGTLFIERPPITGANASITNEASILFGNAANQVVLVKQSADDSAGRSLSLISGRAGTATALNSAYAGGGLNLTAGAATQTGTGSANGGVVTLTAGNGAGTSGVGGNILLAPGSGTSSNGQVQFFSSGNNVSSAGNLTLVGTITAATSSTINGLSINSGALSGVTTINASGQITSTLATGTAPFSVASTTNVANLNASSLNGATFANPGTIGGGTAGAGTFTTLTAQTSITSGTTTVGGLLQGPIDNTAGTEKAFILNHSGTALVQAADRLFEVQEGGVAKFSVDKDGLVTTASINNASVATSAGIVYSKLNLTTSIVGGDLATNISISTTGNLATTSTGTITSAGLLTASNGFTLTTGTLTLPANSVADAALSSNVALLTGTQTFTGAKTFATATATDDTLILSPFVGGAARFLGSITSADLTAARTYTLPDAGGTFAVAGSNAIGLSSAGAISLTLSGNTADTTTTTNSGLVVTSTGVSMLRGCGAGQILKWTSPSWACANDDTGAGGTFVNFDPAAAQASSANSNAIFINRTALGSLLNLTQNTTLAAAYTGEDNLLKRNLVGGTNAQGGALVVLRDTSTGTGTINPTALLIDFATPTGATLFTGNFVDFKKADTAGSATVSKFSISSAGNITAAGTVTLSAFGTAGVVHNSATGLLTSSLLVNADVDTSAAIAYSKLNLATSIVGGDLATNISISTTGNLATTSTGTITSAGLLTASNGFTLTTGTLTLPAASIADGALSTNVALLTGTQTFTGAKTFATATSTDDSLSFSPFVGGAARFNGAITSLDLTAARTYTFQDSSGIVPLSTAGNTVFFTTTGATALTLPTSGTVTALGNTVTGSGAIVLQASPTLTGTVGLGATGANLTFSTLFNNTVGSDTALIVNHTGTAFAQATDLLIDIQEGGVSKFSVSKDGQVTSAASTGTAPFVVSSTTNVANLNASSLNGATFANPGTIGGTTPGAATFTTLTAQTSITSGTTTVGGLFQAPIDNTAGTEKTFILNHSGTALVQAADRLFEVQEGGVAKFSVDKDGLVTTASINNASVATSAGIVYSKLNLTTSIVGGDLATNISISTTGNLATTSTGTITSAGLLTASNGFTLTTGTLTLPANSVADAALSSNVALLTGTQTFTGAKTFATATATDDTLTLSPFAGGAGRFLGSITSVDLTAARTYTLPDAGGTFAVAGSNAIGLSTAGAISLTISGNTADATTTTNSGLVVTSTGLSLLRGCGASQILKWTSPSWACADDATGAGGSPVNLDPAVAQTSTTNNSIDINKTNAAGSYLNLNRTLTAAGAYSLNEAVLTRTVADGGFASTGSILKLIDSGTGTGAVSPDLLLINQANTSSGGVTGNLINAQLAGSSKFSVSTAGLVTQNGNLTFSGSSPNISASTAATALTLNAGTTGTITLGSTSTGNVGFFNVANNFITSTGALTIAGAATVNGTGTSSIAGLTTLGSATLVSSTNLLQGTVDTTSTGNFLRFVNEATEKFTVDVNGAVVAASSIRGTTGTFTAATPSLTLGTASTSTGGIVFQNGTNANTVTLNSGVTSPSSYALTLPIAQGGSSTFLQNDGSGGLSWGTGGGGCSTCLFQVPGTTAQNTVTPTAASVVGLTVNATAGTAATTAIFNQSQAADLLQLNMTNTAGTIANGLIINRNGTGGTTTSLLNLTQTLGTATNGIIFNGTIGTDITTAAARALNIDSGTTGAINVGTGANAKTITVGNTQATTALVFEGGTGATAIQIGNGAAAHGIQIGTGAAVQTLVLGSNNTTSKITLNAGNISTTTGTGGVHIGSDATDNNLVYLQLDSYNTYADTASTCTTTVNQGAMFYNSVSGAVRVCDNGSWDDMVSTGALGLQLFGVVPDSGLNPGDLAGVTDGTAFRNGPCKVSVGATTTTVSWTGCNAFSGGRKVIVTAGTATTATGAANDFAKVCLSGANNQPELTPRGTEVANLVTKSLPSVTTPIVCLADIKFTGTAATITQIYDTRTYTTTDKLTVSVGTTNPALGHLVQFTATRNVVIPMATLNGNNLAGVVVATTGAFSTNTINAIIAVSGPAAVKAITGTNLVGAYIFGSATAGYASTVATKPTEATSTIYNLLGSARTAWTGATACAINSDVCAGSILTYIDKR